MRNLIFSKKAENDLEGIYRYGFINHGEQQAEKYMASLKDKCQILADHPYIYRERHEFNPPVRLHHHEHHLIIYTIEHDHVLIVRIRHERTDIINYLDG